MPSLWTLLCRLALLAVAYWFFKRSVSCCMSVWMLLYSSGLIKRAVVETPRDSKTQSKQQKKPYFTCSRSVAHTCRTAQRSVGAHSLVQQHPCSVSCHKIVFMHTRAAGFFVSLAASGRKVKVSVSSIGFLVVRGISVQLAQVGVHCLAYHRTAAMRKLDHLDVDDRYREAPNLPANVTKSH